MMAETANNILTELTKAGNARPVDDKLVTLNETEKKTICNND